MLHVAGTTLTRELKISGGADIAEPFDVAEPHAVPGMLVSIDPSKPGELRISREEYDPKVAGIVSGANGIRPGMTLQQEGSVADGHMPVALTGRVYCWCDAEAKSAS